MPSVTSMTSSDSVLPSPGDTPSLASVFSFDQRDLAANRRGLTSEAQRERLQGADRKRQRTLKTVSLTFAAIPTIVAVVVTVVFATGKVSSRGALYVTWPIAGAMILLAIGLIRSNPPVAVPDRVDALRGPANLVEVQHEQRHRNRTTGVVSTRVITGLQLSVGGRTFAVPAQTSTVLAQGSSCVAYVAGDQLMAIETE